MRVSTAVSIAGHAAVGWAVLSQYPFEPRQDDGAMAFASNRAGSLKLSPQRAPVLQLFTGKPGSEIEWSAYAYYGVKHHQQSISGFGAAVTDSTVTTFNTLSDEKLNSLVDTLMNSSAEDGAGLSLMRHTIGSSDLSASPAYTYDDNSGNADPDLRGFYLGDRGEAMADLLSKMKSRQPNLKVVGSSWSAPGWMKLNHNLIGSTINNNLNDSYIPPNTCPPPSNGCGGYSEAFAQYFIRYIQEYSKRNATIDAITIQNEPLNSRAGFPTMYMYSREQGCLIQNCILPAFALANISTKVWAYDHNTDHPEFPQDVLDSADVNTVAWHCYAKSLDWTVLSRFKDSYPDVVQYMTECWTPNPGNWTTMVDFIMGPLQNWASGVISWPLGTDVNNGPHLPSEAACGTCTGLVTISNGKYTLQPAYYMMAQFSKFMPPGAVILPSFSITQAPKGVIWELVVSINPDKSRTVVFENSGKTDVNVSLYFGQRKREQWSGTLPMESVTTWVLPP